MSDDNHEEESRDMTMEVSGDELRALRQSSQLKAFSRADGLSESEDDSTKSINRDSLVQIIKSEFRESHEVDESQGFGIIKRVKKPKHIKPKPEPASLADPTTAELALPDFEGVGSVNSDATLSVSAEVLRSLREDPLESTLDEPLDEQLVSDLFAADDHIDPDMETIAISKEMVSEAEQLLERSQAAQRAESTPQEPQVVHPSPHMTATPVDAPAHHEMPATSQPIPETTLASPEPIPEPAIVQSPDGVDAESHTTHTETAPTETSSAVTSPKSKLSLVVITLLVLIAVGIVIALKLSGLLGE